MIRAAREQGKCVKVMVSETRPALQGSRLTAFELRQDGFDVTLITDAMLGYVMSRGMVNKVIVGADRITKTGHVFNKIGTYQIAIIAREHGVPFYPAAPASTFDLKTDWRDVIIEERSFEEVVKVGLKRVAPKGVSVLNPAFDVTPPEFVTAMITDRGIIKPPYKRTVAQTFKRA